MLLEPEDRPELPDFLTGASSNCPSGATFRQARDHMQFCKVVDSFSSLQLAELKELTKAMAGLYISQQIALAEMLKQDFSGFPTNVDRV